MVVGNPLVSDAGGDGHFHGEFKKCLQGQANRCRA